MTEASPLITSLSFVGDLGFITLGTSVKEIARILETVVKTVLEWGTANAVTYDTLKTEAVLFSRSHCQQLNK